MWTQPIRLIPAGSALRHWHGIISRGRSGCARALIPFAAGRATGPNPCAADGRMGRSLVVIHERKLPWGRNNNSARLSRTPILVPRRPRDSVFQFWRNVRVRRRRGNCIFFSRGLLAAPTPPRGRPDRPAASRPMGCCHSLLLACHLRRQVRLRSGGDQPADGFEEGLHRNRFGQIAIGSGGADLQLLALADIAGNRQHRNIAEQRV